MVTLLGCSTFVLVRDGTDSLEDLGALWVVSASISARERCSLVSSLRWWHLEVDGDACSPVLRPWIMTCGSVRDEQLERLEEVGKGFSLPDGFLSWLRWTGRCKTRPVGSRFAVGRRGSLTR